MNVHPNAPDCPDCAEDMISATVSGGGRVAWFCLGCEVIYPAEGMTAENQEMKAYES